MRGIPLHPKMYYPSILLDLHCFFMKCFPPALHEIAIFLFRNRRLTDRRPDTLRLLKT